MLNQAELVAFVPTSDFGKARAFYEGVLGLPVVSEDRLALVLDANGTMLRLTQVQNFNPQQFTIVGWEIHNIEAAVTGLTQRGVHFEITTCRDRMNAASGIRRVVPGSRGSRMPTAMCSA